MKFVPVSIAGGYWTGSSAVMDLLSEHSSCATFSQEFTAFSNGQMFSDLQNFLSAGASAGSAVSGAIWRFKKFNSREAPIVNSVIRRLCAGLGVFPPQLFVPRIGMGHQLGIQYREACREFVNYVQRGLEEEILEHEKLSSGIQHILLAAAHAVGRHEGRAQIVTAFDQLVAPAYAAGALDFIPNLKMIVVDRDWRDQFVEVRNQIPRMVRVKAALSVKAWDEELGLEDADPMTFFIRIRNKIDATKREVALRYPSQILWVRFEDLVRDTSTTAQTVFDFLELPVGGWKNRNTHFLPSQSIRSIGKWKTSPYLDEISHLSRILPGRH